MADKYLNLTDLTAIKQWIEGKFGLKVDLNTLEDKVDEIIAEGGEPNVIEAIKTASGRAVPITDKTAELPDYAYLVPSPSGVNISDSDYSYTVALASAIPKATSDLTNDGDGDSNFATEFYVAQHGGKIDVIQVNGTAQTITNKTVNIPVPTKTSDITNDSDFQSEAEVQALIDAELADITSIDFQVVQTLPATGEHGVIYLLQKTGTSGDLYDEYIWVTPTGGTAHFEKIGTTEVDLSDYWTMTAGQNNSLIAATVAEVNAILEPSA